MAFIYYLSSRFLFLFRQTAQNLAGQLSILHQSSFHGLFLDIQLLICSERTSYSTAQQSAAHMMIDNARIRNRIIIVECFYSVVIK